MPANQERWTIGGLDTSSAWAHEWMEGYIRMQRQKQDQVTFKLFQRTGVEVRQPKWMPGFIWRWMWRRVILIETPLEVGYPSDGLDSSMRIRVETE